jgi:putative aldouronate transport system substrate-binding protein
MKGKKSLKKMVLPATVAMSACMILGTFAPSVSTVALGASTSNQPVTMSVFATQFTGQNLETNAFSKLLEKKYNVKFQWQVATQDATQQKRQLLMTSGDYPDVLMEIPWVDELSPTDIIRYGQQGVIIPLNKLIKQYAPHIQHLLNTTPYFRQEVTSPDGNIYSLGQMVNCYHCSYPSKMWIDTTWLKKLGLKMPKTTAEFKKALEAFKNDDPNGDGKKDEIPLSGANEPYGTHIDAFLMNAFIYDDDSYYFLVNHGKVDLAANKPQWRQGLEYLNSLYKEGLIDPGAFTQDAAAYQQLGSKSPNVLGAGAGMHPAIFLQGNRLWSSEFKPVAPLTGPSGVSLATYVPFSVQGGVFEITNKASQAVAIAAIKMLDYMFTPQGQMIGNVGPEGVEWVPATAKDKGLGGAKALYKQIQHPANWQSPNDAWGPQAQYYQVLSFRDSEASSTNIYGNDGYERRLYEATQNNYQGHAPKEYFPAVAWIDPSQADQNALLKTNITSYIQSNMDQFITGSKDINNDSFGISMLQDSTDLD